MQRFKVNCKCVSLCPFAHLCQVKVTETYNVKRIFKNKKREVYTVGKPPYRFVLNINE